VLGLRRQDSRRQQAGQQTSACPSLRLLHAQLRYLPGYFSTPVSLLVNNEVHRAIYVGLKTLTFRSTNVFVWYKRELWISLPV
jgi:hypothetical protein